MNNSEQQPQGKSQLPPDPDKIRGIVAEKRKQTAEQGDQAPRHPDVKREKQAARASGDPTEEGQGPITNPKENSSNQYR